MTRTEALLAVIVFVLLSFAMLHFSEAWTDANTSRCMAACADAAMYSEQQCEVFCK